MIVYKFKREGYRGEVSDTFDNYYKYSELENIQTKLRNIKTVSSLNNGDKVFIPSWVDFPRYRLREYGRIHNISITRDPAKADVIVINQKQQGLDCSNSYKVNTISKNGEEVIKCQWSSGGAYLPSSNVNITLYTAIEDLNNYPTKRFIDIGTLSQLVSTHGIVLTEEHFDNLNRMLKTSNTEDVDLALEQMANCNYEASIVKLWILWNMNRNTCRGSGFSKSVNCQNILTFFESKGLTSYHSYGDATASDVIKELYTAKIPVDVEDLNILNELVKEQIEDSISGVNSDDIGFKIRNFDIEFFLEKPEYKELEQQVGLNLTGLPN